MRRAFLAIVGTIAGLVALLSYKTKEPESAIDAAAELPPAEITGGAAPEGGGGAPARTYTGTKVETEYGPVQVRITVAGGKITKVQPLALPSKEPRSRELARTHVPKLGAEALAKQSADIDTVSGATYTSGGYKKSLQSAIDQIK